MNDHVEDNVGSTSATDTLVAAGTDDILGGATASPFVSLPASPSNPLEDLQARYEAHVATLELRIARLEEAVRVHVTNGSLVETIVALERSLFGE